MTVTRENIANEIARLLDRAAAGEEIAITDGGKEIAKLVPSSKRPPFPFEELQKFHESIQVTGESGSETVIRMRREERA